MNSPFFSMPPFKPDVNDELLAETAIRIQLAPSQHRLATERYETIGRFLSNSTALRGPIREVFTQGSMAIGATVAARGDDEFDIDLVADVGLPSVFTRLSAAQVLDDFYQAFLASDRYRSMCERKTRCIQIRYADGMHLDVTPYHPRDALQHGHVMHHRGEERRKDPNGRRVASTPRGFAEWFEACMPNETGFAQYFEQRSREFDLSRLMEKGAEVANVPDHEPAYLKPRAKVALQLIKRNRNLCYARRDEKAPPSILLSKLVADAAGSGWRGRTLIGEVLRITRALREVFQAAAERGSLVAEVNPRDPEESLTDRWPEDLDQQRLYLADLDRLEKKLDAMQVAPIDQKRKILHELFGERVAQRGAEAVSKRLARNIGDGSQGFVSGGLGGLVIGQTTSDAGTHVPRVKKFYGA